MPTKYLLSDVLQFHALTPWPLISAVSGLLLRCLSLEGSGGATQPAVAETLTAPLPAASLLLIGGAARADCCCNGDWMN